MIFRGDNGIKHDGGQSRMSRQGSNWTSQLEVKLFTQGPGNHAVHLFSVLPTSLPIINFFVISEVFVDHLQR